MLMDMVNKHEDVIGEMNGCIINCFRSDSARHYAHSDNESYRDEASSIATVSLGPTRIFNIYENKHKPTNVLTSFQLANGSLMLMQPGSQKVTKHKIEKDTAVSETVRYSISFRKLVDKGNIAETATGTSESPNECPDPPTTLIIGTSIADDLNADKLAGRHKTAKVIKLCKRGGHIKQLSDMLDDFYKSSECNSGAVKKVIISVGTNDIRYCRKGVGHLFFPVKNLIHKIKTFFPDARVYLQSLIPVRYQHNNPENPHIVKNVLEFNRLLLKVAMTEDCLFFDMFGKFLDSTPSRIPIPGLYRDTVHLSTSGLSILARAFIQIIRGRNCPIINV